MASEPVITRRTTQTVSWVCLGSLVLRLFIQPTSDSSFGNGALALVVSTSAVTTVVSLVFGLVLAWRARSVLWALVVVVLGPAGSVACALWSKQPSKTP
jgi:hypothetical protein